MLWIFRWYRAAVVWFSLFEFYPLWKSLKTWFLICKAEDWVLNHRILLLTIGQRLCLVNKPASHLRRQISVIVPGQENSFCVYKGPGFQYQIFGLDVSAFFFSQITTHTHTCKNLPAWEGECLVGERHYWNKKNFFFFPK